MCYSLSLTTVSSFFAQVIGFYIILMCLSMLLQPERFKKIMTTVLGHPASLFICSATNIIFALVILTPHNVWVASWPLLITLIGWLALVKGVGCLFFPEKYRQNSCFSDEKTNLSDLDLDLAINRFISRLDGFISKHDRVIHSLRRPCRWDRALPFSSFDHERWFQPSHHFCEIRFLHRSDNCIDVFIGIRHFFGNRAE